VVSFDGRRPTPEAGDEQASILFAARDLRSGLGCFLLLGDTAIKQTDGPRYLGLICLLLAVCVAALIESLHLPHKRIEGRERKLFEKQSPAESNATANGSRVAGS
jgi:hypothetical protein